MGCRPKTAPRWPNPAKKQVLRPVGWWMWTTVSDACHSVRCSRRPGHSGSHYHTLQDTGYGAAGNRGIASPSSKCGREMVLCCCFHRIESASPPYTSPCRARSSSRNLQRIDQWEGFGWWRCAGRVSRSPPAVHRVSSITRSLTDLPSPHHLNQCQCRFSGWVFSIPPHSLLIYHSPTRSIASSPTD